MNNSKSSVGGYPGMLDFLVSLVPWVVFWWVQAGFQSVVNFIPLALSLGLLLYKLKLRRFAALGLDVASLVYFVIFSWAAMSGQPTVWLEHSAAWGHLYLAAVTGLSLLLKRPITAGFTAKNFTDAGHHQSTFRAMNHCLTTAWMLIFFGQALFFACLSSPAAPIIMLVVLVLLIFLSIAFTYMAPVLLDLWAFSKNDWRVKIDRERPLAQGEYDVIIAGAGIGGLTCAALLAKRGYRVAVFEHQQHVGGYCSSFTRKGFTFNTGVQDISGLGEHGSIHVLLSELGLSRAELFARNSTRFLFKGQTIDLPPDLNELIVLLSRMFPAEGENLTRFFAESKAAYEESYQEAGRSGIVFAPELLAKRFGMKELLSYPQKRKHAYKWIQATYRQKLDEFFEDEDLKALLSAWMVYMGTEANTTSAISALAACLTFPMFGGYAVKGGAQAFAEALRATVEKHGGALFLRTKVEGILVEQGQVRGVKTAKGRYFSSVVVSNIDAKSTFNELLPQGEVPPEFLADLNEQKMSTSFFLLYLGVKMDLTSYPTLIKNLEEGWEVTINSNTDAQLAPPGHASVTVLLDKDIKYEDFPDRSTPEYAMLKAELAKTLIEKVNQHIPGIKDQVVFQETATPRTFERYNLMPEGAVYSLDQSLATKRPFFKSPVKGLYLVGASVFPGAGVEPAIISGKICAADIGNWRMEQVRNRPRKEGARDESVVFGP